MKNSQDIVRYENRRGKRWSKEELLQLHALYKKDVPLAELAEIHDRTEYAVEIQLFKHGLISENPMDRVLQ